MLRKTLLTAAFVAVSAIYLSAAERATFVLIDGERKSGQVVFHGEQAENIINGYFALGNDAGGPEFGFAVNQVAVIDFAGGDPSTAERQAVPADDGQLLVLRNGQIHKGKLINLIRGTTIIWDGESGRQEIPIRDAARVYVSGRLARTAYLRESTPTPAASAAQPAPPVASAQSRAVSRDTFEIQGHEDWFDTGLTVRRGERYVFKTTGAIKIEPNGQSLSADGQPGMRNNTYPVPTALCGTLIAKIGNGRPFVLGTNGLPVTMMLNGRLMLGINDDILEDNSGAFTVTATRQ